MNRRLTLLVPALALLLILPLRGDLDVGIIPGTPIDWLDELPFHDLENPRTPIYTHAGRKKKKKEPEGHTEVVPPPSAANKVASPQVGSFNPVEAARILTHDVVNHMVWTRYLRMDELPRELAYPPRVRAGLYWRVLGSYLRVGLHPQRTSLTETVNYLAMIGPPVREILPGEEQQQRNAVQAFVREIPKVPSAPPSVKPLLKSLESEEQRMLARYIARELVSDHYYAYNPLYAKRTKALGPEAVPILLDLSHSPHALLRENATALLAAFSRYDKRIVERLRELASHRDRVTNYRALDGLMRWRDPATVEMLVDSLNRGNRYQRVFALGLLGRAGASKGYARTERSCSTSH